MSDDPLTEAADEIERLQGELTARSSRLLRTCHTFFVLVRTVRANTTNQPQGEQS